MIVRRWNSRAFAALAVLVLLLVGLAIGAATQNASAVLVRTNTSSTLQVTTSAPYMFSPNAIQQVPTNTTINVTVTDADALPHTFSILNLEGVQLPASADIAQLFAQHGALFTKNVTGSGGQAFGSFTSPGPGWYEFVCLESGHFQEGMYGFITFGMNLPSNLTVSTAATGPGAAVFIIIGTIVSLVVIAIVLGFVVGQRRGSEFEMPPERLGYAEPVVPGGNAPLPPSHVPKG